MKKSDIKLVISLLVFLTIWILWFNFSWSISLNVFMKNQLASRFIIIFLSLVLASAVLYRAIRNGNLYKGNWNAIWKGYTALVLMFVMMLWHAPEVFVYLTSNVSVSHAVEFEITHPGPKNGKHSHCQAGIIYYDDFLLRKIELCANNADVNMDAEHVYIERKISHYGVSIRLVRFVR